MATRDYTTRRLGIVNALVEQLKNINGTGNFLTDLNQGHIQSNAIKNTIALIHDH